jgi:serine/threonine-protein kinase
MSINSILTDLLLQWEDNPSLTAEELCQEYKDRPDYMALLGAVKQGRRDVQVADLFLAASDKGDAPLPSSSMTWRDDPPETAPSGSQAGLRGRYRLVSKHRAGGLGEVWKAKDEELDRDVALKRIKEEHRRRPDYADLRRSFLREAEITAKLDHPGIVPVHGLVHDAADEPYYAMRFIQGETLDDAIKKFHEEDTRPNRDSGERSLTLRQLLNRFIAVCNTLAYAHNRGVLHRDLKPLNIMLGDYGETLVLDWGMAKPFERTEAERSTDENTLEPTLDDDAWSATRPGYAKGTREYMSPEQAKGQWDEVGARSDIFSLGATLYAILTGQPPYQGRDKLEILRKARQGDFLPPRQVKKDIPRALEAICQKAMALRPEHRYATALNLGQDVDKWLADQPVEAWREPWWVKARRWLGRHRTLVTSAAAVLVVTVLSLSGLAILLTIHNEELAAANKSERAARRVAEGNFRLMSTLYGEIGKSKSAVAAFQKALDTTEKLVKDQPDVPEYRKLQVQSQFNLGVLYKEIGQFKDAENAYQKALATSTRFAQDYPDVLLYQQFQGHSLNSLGFFYDDVNRQKDAEDFFVKALKVRKKLAEDHPDVAAYRADLAQSYSNLGVLYKETNRPKDAESAYQEALKIRQELVTAFPADSDYQADLATSHYNLGVLDCETERFPDAEAAHGESRKIRSELARKYPGVPEYEADLAWSHNGLGIVYRETKRPKKAVEALEEVLRIREKLVAAHPGIVAYQADLASGCQNLALLYQETPRPKDAEELYNRALVWYERLAEAYPRVTEYQVDRANAYNSLATLYAETTRPVEAETMYRKALVIQERVARDHAKRIDLASDLGRTYSNLGSLMQDQGKPATAVACFSRSIRILEGVQRHDPHNATVSEVLPNAKLGRSQSLLKVSLQQPAAEVKDWDQALEIDPGPHRGFYRWKRARALVRQGDHVQAVAEAMDLARDKTTTEFTVHDLACVCSLAAAAVPKDGGLQADEQKRLAELYAVQAVALFWQAREAGFFKEWANVARMKNDTDLRALHQREDFKKLLRELEEMKR